MADSPDAPRKPQDTAPLRAVSQDDFFSAKHEIQAYHTSELVIALCGPIGSPIHKIADALKTKLERDFFYEKCEIIRLSDLITKHSEPISTSSSYGRVRGLIKRGNKLREEHGASILAELAISRIALQRQLDRSHTGLERYAPRRVCHIIDSIKNQEELETLKLVYRDMLYFVGVYSPLPTRTKSLQSTGMSEAEIFTLIDQDSGEEFDHGQTVRNTYPQADFFLRIDSNTDSQISASVLILKF